MCSRVVVSVELFFVLKGSNVPNWLVVAWRRLLFVLDGRRILDIWCAGLIPVVVSKMQLRGARFYRLGFLLRNDLKRDRWFVLPLPFHSLYDSAVSIFLYYWSIG